MLPPHSFNIGGVKQTFGLRSDKPCLMLAQPLIGINSKVPRDVTACKANLADWTALQAQSHT